MISFKIFNPQVIVEQVKESKDNTALGAAYETATALHVHDITGSKHNKSPEHVKRMAEIKREHDENMAKLPEDKRAAVLEAAKKSGDAYVKSLAENHGIKPEDIHEVHHTYAGIDKLIGKKVSRAGNPHDIVIKTKDGRMHGASLKFKPGTLANTTANRMDELNNQFNIKTNLNNVWESAKKKIGIDKLTNAQLKEIRDKPEIVKANQEAQSEAAHHHATAFNSASTEDQKALLRHVMKSHPDMPYDYVVGSKGTSEPIERKKHHIMVDKAKNFKAVSRPGGQVHIYDHEGNHLLTFEHRPTHGSFLSIQTNAKYGTGKPTGPVNKEAGVKAHNTAPGFALPFHSPEEYGSK